jgi:regulator of protease activity HflC (stomatin/prohibitin superfamily)
MTVGNNEDIKRVLIDPAIQESVKAATAKYTAEELITKRTLVREDIMTNLKNKLSIDNIDIIALNITNFKFSDTFDIAIENKVKAEQDALTQKNKLEQIKYEAQQTIESAKAQAESIRIQAQAITSQG